MDGGEKVSDFGEWEGATWGVTQWDSIETAQSLNSRLAYVCLMALTAPTSQNTIQREGGSINLKDIRPGPIRRLALSPELMLRIDTVRAALAEVCGLTEEDWKDAFQRDVNPEQEMLWWERIAGCYMALVATQAFLPDQRQAAFKRHFRLVRMY